ncbi:MAG: MBL fold metallo-hydrolase [Bryobacteraceae bacterium]|jgi:L-ascorbate metabolism protein UlaG (beta-lactamase superfamily)
MKAALSLLLLAAASACAQPSRAADEFQTSAGVVKITPIHHASVLIQGGGVVIHVDPFREGDYTGLPMADLVLITHDHFDHMDPKALALIRNAKTVVMAPAAVADSIAGVAVLRNGEARDFGEWRIEAVPAYNLVRGPAAGQLFHPKGRGNGYVLTYGGKRFYFSGDTEGVPEMRALKNIDVAYVCMNLPYTMPPEEAAAAVRAFHPRVVIPYHYRNSDLGAFEKALAGSGIEVHIRDFYYR